MKKIIKIFIIMLLLVCIILGVKVYPVIKSGFELYKEAMENRSIEDAITDIKTKENYIELEEIPKEYREALIHSEDRRFYYHFGIDPIATARAMVSNLKAGRFLQGGSTITQQLAKNLYFSFEKKYERKIAELLVAFKLEKMLTKDEILELYCNVIYFGEGCYGIKEAASHYYGIEPSKLTTSQIEALVYTIKSPNNYNPNEIAVNLYPLVFACK